MNEIDNEKNYFIIYILIHLQFKLKKNIFIFHKIYIIKL